MSSPDRGTNPVLSRRRKWAFRLGSSLLVPLLVLAFLEAVLRLAGFGYPTNFFLKTRINGRARYVENDKFGLRFFPPALARSPSPLVMPAGKTNHTCRLFILGESAALGDPEPAFGFGRFLQVLLNERFPGTRFEVVCAAMTAINSHVILPIARDCARREGDVWIIYMGNSEFVGLFGTGTVFGPQAPSLGFVRFALALKATKIGQLLDALLRSFGAESSRRPSWGGMKMFLDHQVGPDDPRKQRVYKYFQRNLEDILRVAEPAGVKVVLSTVASNLKDCAPFASRHSSGLRGSRLADWQKFYDGGVEAELAGDFAKAVGNYSAAEKIDPSFAELHFRLGRCHLALTNYTESGCHFELARDLDALPFRADTRLNRILQETAIRHAGRRVYLADVSALAEKSPQGIPGNEFFFEHVHLNFEGNYLLGRTVADQVLRLLPESIADEAKGEWASLEVCARRLALTDWDRRRVYDAVLRRLSEAPFVNQMNHSEQLAVLREKLASIRADRTAEAVKAARAIYQSALTADPDDFYLRGDFARFLEETGDVLGSIAEWQRVRDLLPFEPAPYYFAGKLLAREGKTDEALQYLSRTIEIRPDFADALDEKGQLLLQQRKANEALPLFEKAARLQPTDARICVHTADALGALNRRAEALDRLREAVQLRPDYWEARYFMGVELALQDRIAEAREQFAEVVRLQPNYALGHLNLGVALAKQGRLDDALVQFRETLRLDPRNKLAQQHRETIESLKSRGP